MAILWLTENYPPQRGGMAQSCDRIVDHLRKRGHIINVLHFTGRDASFRITQQINGWHASIPFEESEAHTLNLTWEFVRHKPVSAIVCFGGYLPMLAAPVFCKWMSVPLLTMVRGNDFDSAIFTPRKRDMMRDALEASQVVTVVSSDKAEKIRKMYAHVNVQYIPNGIDTKTWNPSPSETAFAEKWKSENAGNKICIGLFGQLKAKKGIHFLFNSLQQSALLPQLHFLMIGEITEDVNAIMTSKGFSVSSFSFLDRYEMLKFYLCCDAVAIPSFYDGMPNVLLEAGALAVPVIASNVDGMKDVIHDHESGILFSPGDPSSCRKAFFDFVNLPGEKRLQLGLHLQSSINENYLAQFETDRYEQLLQTLLDGNRTAFRLHAQ